MKKRAVFATTCAGLMFSLTATPGDANEIQTYVYDAQGRLISVSYAGTINNGQKHSVCYDTADNRTQYKSDSTGAGVTCPNGNPPPPPTLPTITISDGNALEGTNATFTVALSNPFTSSISVSYATATGTAGATDFTAATGMLTFAPGETQKTVLIFAKTDTKLETDEYFYCPSSEHLAQIAA